MYAFDVDATRRWQQPLSNKTTPLAEAEPGFWSQLEPSRIRVGSAKTEAGNPAVRLQLAGARTFYTIVQHIFSEPQDFSNRDYLFLRYRGTGEGTRYRLAVDFDPDHLHTASYTFTDQGLGWRTRAFSLKSPQLGEAPFDWSRVISLRLASDSKSSQGRLDIETPRLSRRVQNLRLSYPVAPSTRGRNVLVTRPDGRRFNHRLPPGRSNLALKVAPSLLGSSSRITVPPAKPLSQDEAVPVHFRRNSASSYDFSVDTKKPGVLVFNQGFDPNWKAKTADGSVSPIPVSATVNGYVLRAGKHSGSIRFKGQGLAFIGLCLSLVFLAATVAWLVIRRRPSRLPSKED